MQVTLKTITPNAEVNIVEIARVSSTRQDKSEKPEGLINYLIKNKHWSPFEHSMMTVEIVTSKAIGIQLLRHRSFYFQEFSQRYAVVNEIEPVELRQQADKNRQSSTDVLPYRTKLKEPIEYEEYTIEHVGVAVTDIIEKSKKVYDALIKTGIAKEVARMVLPMATQTTIYMSGTIRSWIHFLDVRDDAHAQKEAQLIAKEIKKIFIQECPIISRALEYGV